MVCKAHKIVAIAIAVGLNLGLTGAKSGATPHAHIAQVGNTLSPPPLSSLEVQVPPPKVEKPDAAIMPPWAGQRPPMPVLYGALELTPAQVFALVAPSVYIVVAGQKGKDALGSAVGVSADWAVTSCHAVHGQRAIALIDDQTGKVFDASVAHAHEISDRCLLRVQGNLKPITGVRRIANLAVGERVYTIGNPAGLTKTLSEGVISGLQSEGGIRYVQTTAPISEKSSGGAVVDGKGALIGVTTFKDTQNMNFAIAAEEFWR